MSKLWNSTLLSANSSTSEQVRLIRIQYLPILTYEADTWTQVLGDIRRLQAVVMKFVWSFKIYTKMDKT